MVDELAAVSEGLAEKGPDFERRIGEEAGVRNRPDPAAVEVADDDLLVGDDAKEGSGTFIAKATRFLPGCARFPVVRPGRRHASGSRVVVGPLRLAAP